MFVHPNIVWRGEGRAIRGIQVVGEVHYYATSEYLISYGCGRKVFNNRSKDFRPPLKVLYGLCENGD